MHHVVWSFGFNMFYRNGYVYSGNVGVKIWFSHASREPYMIWAEMERNAKF